MTSDEALVASQIPATVSDGVATVPSAGASERAPFADGLGRGASLQDATGATPRLASDAVSVAEAGIVQVPKPQRAEASHLHPLPKRRELSYRVAALAYTWAAIERRKR